MGQVFTKKTGEEGDGKYMVSTGLYKTCDWDHRTVKKMIIEKKIGTYLSRERINGRY